MAKPGAKIDYLKLDPDEMMRTMDVADVGKLALGLKREVDTKREELRVMVGERYRDLIEAADTIQTMKSSSESIIQGVDSTLISTATITNYPPNLNILKSKETSLSVSNHAYLSVAASIQLLMTAPERIWQAVDNQELTSAVQLYLISQHVYTGLQGDQGGGISPERIRQWFPVISRYYATINNFYPAIINSANECLMTVDLDEEKALQALTALLLLKGLTSEELFSTFLRLRRQSLEQAIDAGRSGSARSSLCSYLRATICTVRVGAKLFSQQQNLSRFVESLTDVNTAKPTLHLFGSSGLSKLYKYLPNPVLNYRTRLNKPFNNLDQQYIESQMSTWLETSKEAGYRESTNLLRDIDTIQGVAAVKQAVWQFLKNFEPYSEWGDSTKSVVSKDVNIWESFYQQTVRERIENLISNRIHVILQKLEANLKDNKRLSEENLGSYIWQESSSDLNSLWMDRDNLEAPGSRNSKTSFKILNHAASGGLSMKCKGWSLAVKNLCTDLELNLAKLWKEVVDIGKKERTESDLLDNDKGPFDRYRDHKTIVDHYRHVLTTQLASLVDTLRQDGERITSSNTNVAQDLYLARSLQCIPVLVHTLQKSLQSKENEYYYLVEKFVCASKDEFWLWADKELDKFVLLINRLNLEEDPLSLLPAWDTVTIQESSETGSISSTIRIPTCPSAQLVTALHSLAVTLHSAHPATMPDQILNRISKKLCKLVFAKFLALVDPRLTQVVALQMDFNIQFLSTMFLSREFKDDLVGQVEEINTKINANIDPFDQSVFSEHISVRVKRACAREITCLCPIVPKDRAELISGFKPSLPSSSQSSSQDASNMMNLNPNPPSRFQLLPTASNTNTLSSAKSLEAAKNRGGRSPRTPQPAGSSGNTLDVKKTAATVGGSGNRRQRDRSPVAAAAASFFGSMGSSWFGASPSNS